MCCDVALKVFGGRYVGAQDVGELPEFLHQMPTLSKLLAIHLEGKSRVLALNGCFWLNWLEGKYYVNP